MNHIQIFTSRPGWERWDSLGCLGEASQQGNSPVSARVPGERGKLFIMWFARMCDVTKLSRWRPTLGRRAWRGWKRRATLWEKPQTSLWRLLRALTRRRPSSKSRKIFSKRWVGLGEETFQCSKCKFPENWRRGKSAQAWTRALRGEGAAAEVDGEDLLPCLRHSQGAMFSFKE